MKPLIDKKVWDEWRDLEKNEEAPGFFQQLLATTLNSSPKLMDELERVIAEKDLRRVHYCAHTLSSTCKSLGAHSLAAQLKEMENATRAQPPVLREELGKPIRLNFDNFIAEVQAEFDHIKKAG